MTRRGNSSANTAGGLVFLVLVGLLLGGIVWFVSSLGSPSSSGAAFDAASDAAASSFSTADNSSASAPVAAADTTPVALPQPSQSTSCTDGTYTNSAGNTVCRPETSSTVPAGATAQCADGTYSFSQSSRGTCSHHGGVAQWLN